VSGQPKEVGKAAVGEFNGTLHPIQCHFRFGINHLALGTF